MKTKIIVVINQKGGVGKSTVAFHLAFAAIKNEKSRVLCLDMDSQGNLSQYVSGDVDINNVTQGGAGLLFEDGPLVPTKTTHPQIDLLHGHRELDQFDHRASAEARAYSPELPALLRDLGYDYVVIDTPPALGLRHLAPLTWADIAVIPMEPVMSSVIGFQDVLTTIETHILPINPRLKWFGVVNRANMRVRSHREKDAFVRETYGRKILATLSARTSVSDAMEESPAQPVWARKGAPKALRDEWRGFCEQVIGK